MGTVVRDEVGPELRFGGTRRCQERRVLRQCFGRAGRSPCPSPVAVGGGNAEEPADRDVLRVRELRNMAFQPPPLARVAHEAVLDERLRPVGAHQAEAVVLVRVLRDVVPSPPGCPGIFVNSAAIKSASFLLTAKSGKPNEKPPGFGSSTPSACRKTAASARVPFGILPGIDTGSKRSSCRRIATRRFRIFLTSSASPSAPESRSKPGSRGSAWPACTRMRRFGGIERLLSPESPAGSAGTQQGYTPPATRDQGVIVRRPCRRRSPHDRRRARRRARARDPGDPGASLPAEAQARARPRP